MDGHACQIWFTQDSVGAAQEMEWKRCLERNYGFSDFPRLSQWSDKYRWAVSRQQYHTSKERGAWDRGYDGHHKNIKGSKVHAVVTFTSLPVAIDLGPGNEHESRRLITLLKDIRIKSIRRPRSRPKQVYADTKYHTPLVIMYLLQVEVLQLASKNELTGRRDLADHTSLTMERTPRLEVVSRDSLAGWRVLGGFRPSTID